jgi:hypothetical protein
LVGVETIAVTVTVGPTCAVVLTSFVVPVVVVVVVVATFVDTSLPTPQYSS